MHFDLIIILDRVQLSKLHLLGVIDERLQEHDDENDEYDRDPLQVPVLLAMTLHPRAHRERHHARRDQDPHRQVPERVLTQLPERLRRRIFELIHPVALLSLLRRPRAIAQTALQIASERRRDRVDAARARERLPVSIRHPRLERRRVHARHRARLRVGARRRSFAIDSIRFVSREDSSRAAASRRRGAVRRSPRDARRARDRG